MDFFSFTWKGGKHYCRCGFFPSPFTIIYERIKLPKKKGPKNGKEIAHAKKKLFPDGHRDMDEEGKENKQHHKFSLILLLVMFIFFFAVCRQKTLSSMQIALEINKWQKN